ncbi:MAG: hypothetical protein K1X83_05540 [Oligoflexia bacterium]|nr:hypothetical protein [Oligoflexia bacterium]
MNLLALFFVLAAIFWCAGLPAFEFAVGVMLLTPIIAYLVQLQFGAFLWVHFLIMALLIVAAYFSVPRRRELAKRRELKQLFPCGIFALAYLILLSLCLRWPDFIAMGERLRDYAILGSSVLDPVHIKEPWMSGALLYYYAYWYRFGAMLSTALAMPVWSTYHALVAFSLALYFTCAFLIFQRHLGFKSASALFAALLVAIGSNVEGMLNFFRSDSNWWGPSRVIPGAINEFPAWSFLLGDLHPHYLNLCFFPLILLLFLEVANHSAIHIQLRPSPQKVLFYGALILIPPLWLYNANAWEVPMWLGLVGIFGLLLLVSTRGRMFSIGYRLLPHLRTFVTPASLLIAGLILLTAVSLLLSWPSIPGGTESKFSLVRDPIQRSHSWNLVQHWGLPLALIAISTIMLIPDLSWRWLGGAFLAGSLLFEDGLTFLYLLLFLNLLRLIPIFGLGATKAKHPDTKNLLFNAVGLWSIMLLIIPELVFLDDAYGGENERMNTIFKIYTTDWFLLYCFAFYLTARAFAAWISTAHRQRVLRVGQGILAICLIGFFVHTARELRPTVDRADDVPTEEGLSTVQKLFPGSSETIRYLRGLPPGVVLEAQGNPYDYTTFVSTLANHQSFLGWANHVELLTRQYAEVRRRDKLTEELYREGDCSNKAAGLRREGIEYLVYGSLEKRKYHGVDAASFGCLKTLFSSGDYTLYGLP